MRRRPPFRAFETARRRASIGDGAGSDIGSCSLSVTPSNTWVLSGSGIGSRCHREHPATTVATDAKASQQADRSMPRKDRADWIPRLSVRDAEGMARPSRRIAASTCSATSNAALAPVGAVFTRFCMPRRKRKDKTPPAVPPPPEPKTVGDAPEDEPGESAFEDPERSAPARGQPEHESDEVF